MKKPKSKRPSSKLSRQSKDGQNREYLALNIHRTQPGRIATISFPVDHRQPDAVGKAEVIAGIVSRYRPGLLLCAGWSTSTTEDLKQIADAALKAGTTVIVEVIAIRPPRLKMPLPNQVRWMGPQLLSDRSSCTPEAVQRLVKSLAVRTIGWLGVEALLLVCGELSVVKGRNKPTWCEPIQTNRKLKTAFRTPAIILNPTHTRMGNAGTLNAKRAFLSKGRRIYLSASNWDLAADGKRKPQRPSRTLHTMYYNGVYQEPAGGADEGWCNAVDYCYTEWNIPVSLWQHARLLRGKNDRSSAGHRTSPAVT